MRVTRRGDVLRLVRITGPSHNLLGLKLGDTPGPLQMEQLPDRGAPSLAGDDVQREVMAGAADEARELGIPVHVHAIQFVASDTGPPSIYRELARIIVRHHAEERARVTSRPSFVEQMPTLRRQGPEMAGRRSS